MCICTFPTMAQAAMIQAKRIDIKPHRGPQETFLASRADIAIYGGAAGGGKTWALEIEPVRHVRNRRFGAVIFRRTYPQITGEGGLWDEACELYPMIAGAKMVRSDMSARFPSGAKVSFRHMEYEDTKYDWQGTQIPLIEFDELTHFTESQFFYLLSRNRSMCGVRPYVRASCNPDATSWVAKFIAWWIDQSTGYPIPERSGRVRYFVRDGDGFDWSDSRDELAARHPGSEPKSLTFVPASLDDNPTMLKLNPQYRANLMALPRIERERLLGGNWKVTGDTIIDRSWLNRYSMRGPRMEGVAVGRQFNFADAECRRFATVDTAGTSREKAEQKKGKDASHSACAIWDHHQASDLLLLRHVWRGQVGWNDLKSRVPDTLRNWNVSQVHIENAHYGQALEAELSGSFQTHLIPTKIPGMTESHRGAKLERAIASGLLTRLEDGKLLVPDEDGEHWVKNYVDELIAWGGLPDEQADQIDVSSHACYVAKSASASWGGLVSTGNSYIRW